jgi:hypothetical protein
MNEDVVSHSVAGFDSNKVAWFYAAYTARAIEQPMEERMKLLPVAAVLAAFAFAPVAFAQTTAPTPTNKADCEKAKLKWDDKGEKDGKGACVAAQAAAPAKTDTMKK